MAISGTGTATDPYIPTTFADFKTCVGQAGVYVCLMQDIDVSKDSIYKTGITEPLTILCRYVYGTAMTYSDTTAYAVNDKCTYNDGEHGLCTYTCIQACTGIDVSNSEYWTRGGNPTKKITGLIITSSTYFNFDQSSNEITLSNLFFESCVFDKTLDNSMLYGKPAVSYSNIPITMNDCSFSMFYNQHSYKHTITNSATFIFNRCSIYFKFIHTISGNMINHYEAIGSGTRFNNCTIDINGLCAPTSNAYYAMRGLVNSSLHMVCDCAYTSSGNELMFSGTNSFFAITLRNIYGTYYSDVQFNGSFTGVNILDRDVVGNLLFTQYSVQNLVTGTTEQCKDKDWLISQGFFTS